MTFYNPMPPFMPPFFSNRFSHNPNTHQSDFNSNNIKHEHENNEKKTSNFPEISTFNAKFSDDVRESSNKKKKAFLNNYLFDNIFSEIQESDTLILLCLIYLLYIQENNDLMIYILLLILINV